ncbi:MAG: insulinase family protein [Candidatus Latescibacteria bacterium]|nr:insulinase family protein [Candidatus Latescibacterota bacterium]NIM22504.1 insulinase family protein [Candidatus Latescibacterota bacterium]NIM64818.1 insulinase family protein [Candidatus Latescibacterota bacterium]NIO01326.1 insulinase family protein [Candidatus Latescibacterota bacterium]NIO27815.1 insulinase family protein [Candidatus Latescibacterota bacterium]
MKKYFILLLALALIASFTYASKKPGYIEYEEYELDNGLRVILSEDHSVPIVAVDVWYHVGSGHEEPGRSGFAHLFEHMMFQGSENVDKAEHFQLVARAGGNVNGTTSEDRTNYFEWLPANRLNLALWLEADRMRSLAITAENFENQRSTVKEERRQAIDNQPYGAAFLTSDTLSYDFEPYSHTVIGKMADLDAAEVEDVQKFFDLYYAPNNAVLTVVGDINRKKTKKLVEEYFGDIPRGKPVKELKGTEPPHKAEKRMTVDDKNANVPAIFITYIIPPHKHPDTPAISILSNILTEGESSRMHKRLVKDEEAALVVYGGADSRKGPSLFRFIAASNVGVEIATCEELIYDELSKLLNEGVSEDEVNKARIQFKSSFIRGRQTVLNKAEALQHYAYFHDSLEEVNTDLDRYMAVTKEDILRVAKKYFVDHNRTVVIANPVPKESS